MAGATGTDQSSVEQVLVSPCGVAVTIGYQRHDPLQTKVMESMDLRV